MLFKLLLLFTLVPLAELYLLLRIAEISSAGFTFALVLATGIVGAVLARWQGVGWRRRLHEDLSSGRLPTDSLLDGLLIFVAGALLITPGVLTDVLGFSLLTPPFRALCKRAIKRRFMRGMSAAGSVSEPNESPYAGTRGESSSPRDVVIESYVVDRKSDQRPSE